MKALVKRKREPGLWLEDVPTPEYGINDCLIEILRTGICGTDVHIYNWDAWAQKTIPVPMPVGHEFVGRIVATGSNVHDFRVGDIISGDGHVVCGHCRNCLGGRRHLCKDTKADDTRSLAAWPHTSTRAVRSICRSIRKDGRGSARNDFLGQAGFVAGCRRLRCMALAIPRHPGTPYIDATVFPSSRLGCAKKMG